MNLLLRYLYDFLSQMQDQIIKTYHLVTLVFFSIKYTIKFCLIRLYLILIGGGEVFSH